VTARRLTLLVSVLSLAGFSGSPVVLSALVQGATVPNNAESHVRIGDSLVALNGPWKFKIGDSPVATATNAPLWAEPAFDDSGWETVDLTPPNGSYDPTSGTSGYVPGWTAKGHPGYWGYAWYRIRVEIESKPDLSLALAGPSDIDDIYQVFDNGRLIGAFGDFSVGRPKIFTARPMTFPLYSTERGGPNASSTKVLAIRMWMEPNTLTQTDDVGGMHNAPLIGEARAVAAQYQLRWDELVRAYTGSLITCLVFGLLGIVAISLMLIDRADRVYMWIGAVLLALATIRFLIFTSTWTMWLSANSGSFIRYVVMDPLIFAGWVMVWRKWFRLRRPTWIPWLLSVLTVFLMVSMSLGQNLFITILPQPVCHVFEVVSLYLRVLIALLALITVFQGIREQGLEGWIVLPAVLLAGISEFSNELQFLHILELWFPFGVQITLRQLTDLILVAVLALLLLRRLVLSIRSQRRMALDVKQAQEVQQVILPQARTVLPGLVIESEYRPAREVGGDFFQIIPHRTDGSLLIVAGDVTGKGLKAGMLVALLVGAIRSTAELNSNPEFVLQALNRRLLGRGDAQATCLALRIDADGRATLANAGHLPPYLNGQPVNIEGSLPLGMIEEPEFSVMRFRLAENDRLVLMSDGIAEATDADGHLFGFERVNDLLQTATTAAQLAGAAQKFGQEDDISVICVTRSAVHEAVMA
jgi:Stage II sporulation protein E (SpoIIE)